MPKSAKFQNNDKDDPPSGGTIFLSEILVLASSEICCTVYVPGGL